MTFAAVDAGNAPGLGGQITTFIVLADDDIGTWPTLLCSDNNQYNTNYSVFQKKFTPMTFMITMWNE